MNIQQMFPRYEQVSFFCGVTENMAKSLHNTFQEKKQLWKTAQQYTGQVTMKSQFKEITTLK
jgi:hypothetical protein